MSIKVKISKVRFIILSIILLFGISCSGQLSPNENNPISVTDIALVDEVSEHIDSTIINEYKDGKKCGLWKTYHQNGQLKTEGNYKDGLKHGLHKEWQSNGILLLEGMYVNGLDNGLMKWFHEKGHLAAQGSMINGIRNGPWVICDVEENGFCIDAYFNNGKRVGIWRIYHDIAQEYLWKEQTWEDDKIVSEKCWDEKGQVIVCTEI